VGGGSGGGGGGGGGPDPHRQGSSASFEPFSMLLPPSLVFWGCVLRVSHVGRARR
jgi:hypothetical protein